MMQAEFETLIGKEVDYAVYSELVEPVYMYHPASPARQTSPPSTSCRGAWTSSGSLLPEAEEYRRHGRRGQQAARADRPTDGQTQRHQAAAEAAFE